VTVFDVAQLEHGGAGPTSGLVGTLVGDGQSSIEAAFSPDGRYVFVTFEDKDDLQVFNFADAVAHNVSSGSYLAGSVPLGVAPVGVTVSPDGRYLYATSEERNDSQTEGTLTTIDLAEAERSPSHAIVSTVLAGCSPVRVVATSQSVYVTARESDELLEFSASKLVTDPNGALEDRVRVGEAPVGLALADKDALIVVGDSNRFNVPGTTANLAVVKIAADGSLTLAGYLEPPRWSGLFPRDMTSTPDGNTVLISDFDSYQLEAVRIAEAQ
jgi:DNA-binding beta-propeller fold protein YncE